MKEIPFSIETCIKILDHISSEDKMKNFTECDVCEKISEKMHRDLTKDKSFREEISQLEPIMEVSQDKVMRCSICGTIYLYEYHYEYFIQDQSDEEEWLTRSDREGALKLIQKYLDAHVTPKKIKLYEKYFSI